MNPLDTGQPFAMSLANPNPTAGRNKQGPWFRVSFELSEEEWRQFQEAASITGLVIEVDQARAIVAEGLEPSDDEMPTDPVVVSKTSGHKEEPREYGHYAQTLAMSGFMHLDGLIEKVGPDEEYHSWVKTRRCAMTGSPAPNDAHHLRNLDGVTGAGRKDPYTQIPLCHEMHMLWHSDPQKFATELAQRQGPMQEVRTWAEMVLADTKGKFCWEKLKLRLGYDSWACVPPDVLRTWARENGLDPWLPEAYRSA